MAVPKKGGRKQGGASGYRTMDFPSYDATNEAIETLGTYIEAQDYPPPGLRNIDGAWNWSGLLQAAAHKLASRIRAGGSIEPDALRRYLDTYDRGKTVTAAEELTDENASVRKLVHVPHQTITDTNDIASYLLTFENQYDWARGRRIKWGSSFNQKLAMAVALFWNHDYVEGRTQDR